MHKIAKYGIIIFSQKTKAQELITKKGMFSMKTKIFIFLLIVAVAIAIFSAGQLFLVLRNPELVFVVSIAAILLLSIGFFLGKNRKEEDDDE